MHELLVEQLRQTFKDTVPRGYAMDALLHAVSEAYTVSEEDRQRLKQDLREAERLRAVGKAASDAVYEINTPMQFVSDSLQFLHMAFSELGAVFATYAQAAEVLSGKELSSEQLAILRAKVAALPDLVDVPYLQAEIPQALARCVQGTDRILRTIRTLKDHGEARIEAVAEL